VLISADVERRNLQRSGVKSWQSRHNNQSQLDADQRTVSSQAPARQLQVCVQLPTSAANVTLFAFSAERRAVAPLLLDIWWPPLSTAISYLQGAQQQTCCILRLRSNDWIDGRTDRPGRFIRCGQCKTAAEHWHCFCSTDSEQSRRCCHLPTNFDSRRIFTKFLHEPAHAFSPTKIAPFAGGSWILSFQALNLPLVQILPTVGFPFFFRTDSADSRTVYRYL